MLSDGRMIRKSISQSGRLSSLSKESLILWFFLRPHFSSHGKMNGNPHFIKGEIVPKIDFFDLKTIEKSLKEISDKTSTKWFEYNGLMYIQDVEFMKTQKINAYRIGEDRLPSFSQELVKSESRVIPAKEEVKTEVKEEVKTWSFDDIWVKYPSKTGSKRALASFMASVKTEQDWLDINKAIKNYLASDRVKRGYIQNGSTWFNNWRDWVNFTESPRQDRNVGEARVIPNKYDGI